MKFLITLSILLVLSSAVFAVEAERRHRRRHHKKSHTKFFTGIEVAYEDANAQGNTFTGSGDFGLDSYTSVDSEGEGEGTTDGLKIPYFNGKKQESWYIDFTQVENCRFVGHDNTLYRDTLEFTWKAVHSQFVSENTLNTKVTFGAFTGTHAVELASQFQEACMNRQNKVNTLINNVKTTAKNVGQAKVVLDEFAANKQVKNEQYDEWIAADNEEIASLTKSKSALNKASFEATSKVRDLAKDIKAKNEELQELLQQAKDLQDEIDQLTETQSVHQGEEAAARASAQDTASQIDDLNANIQKHQLMKSIVNITPEDIQNTQDSYDENVDTLKAQASAFVNAVSYSDDKATADSNQRFIQDLIEKATDGTLENQDFDYEMNYNDGGYIAKYWENMTDAERKRARKAKIAKRKAKRANKKQRSARRAARRAARRNRRHH